MITTVWLKKNKVLKKINGRWMKKNWTNYFGIVLSHGYYFKFYKPELIYLCIIAQYIFQV